MDKVNPEKTGYYTEPIRQYMQEVKAITRIEDLQNHVEKWSGWMSEKDLQLLQEVKPDQMPELITGIQLETKQQSCKDFVSELIYLVLQSLLLPEFMFRVSVYATEFCVPFGVAYNRLRQVGKLQYKEGRLVWKE